MDFELIVFPMVHVCEPFDCAQCVSQSSPSTIRGEGCVYSRGANGGSASGGQQCRHRCCDLHATPNKEKKTQSQAKVRREGGGRRGKRNKRGRHTQACMRACVLSRLVLLCVRDQTLIRSDPSRVDVRSTTIRGTTNNTKKEHHESRIPDSYTHTHSRPSLNRCSPLPSL